MPMWSATVFLTLCTLSLGSRCPEGLQSQEDDDGDLSSLLQVREPSRLELLEKTGARSVPVFEINLTDAPRKRFAQVASHYREEIIAMSKSFQKELDEYFDAEAQEAWLVNSDYIQYPEYLEEIRGIVENVNDPSVTVNRSILSNLMYEMQSPTSCSGVLWASTSGTVMHGRNMDYAFHFEMPDGSILNWPNVTYEARFSREGTPLYMATMWPAGPGLHTAMRFGGWSFEQQTRTSKNEWHQNLAAARQGGQSFAIVARHVMDTTPDFQAAVTKMYAAKYMAPMYFIMAGAGAYEGAVLTIDRLGMHESHTPPIHYINNTGGWHLVQTNSDLDKISITPRRDIANAIISTEPQSFMTPERMMQFMHTPLLFNPTTVFSTVMIPETGYYKTVLPTDPPSALNGTKVKLAEESGSETWKQKWRNAYREFPSLEKIGPVIQ